MSLNEIEMHCLKDKKQTETLILDNVKTLKLVFFFFAELHPRITLGLITPTKTSHLEGLLA